MKRIALVLSGVLFIACLAALTLVSQPDADVPYVRTDILEKNPPPTGKGFINIQPPMIDDDLVYLHYSVNTKNIVRLDFTNGHWTNLVSSGERDPILIAHDARYIVFRASRSASSPIVVADRKTGETLAQANFTKWVQDTFIEQDGLVLFHGRFGTSSQQAITILELPSLKLVRETTLPGSSLAGISDNRVYTGSTPNGDLMVFDHQFKELGRIKVPPPIENNNRSCGLSIKQYDIERAVLTANCGEIHVIDLKSFSILHSIPRYANFYSVALYDRLIFATAVEQHSPIVVFNMDTGKEVARLPISASRIAIKGNTLLAIYETGSTEKNANLPVETYLINADVIRNGIWRDARVVQQCRQAEALVADTKDIYGAIGLCEDAGIQGYSDSASIPTAIFPSFRQYGLWLSQTLDKFSDAIRILEKVHAVKTDPEVTRALHDARLKAKVISGAGIGDITEAELQTDFGQALRNGNQLSKAVTKTIEFGLPASPVYHFSDDKLYFGRYGCGTRKCDGAHIGVFDRATLDELGSVQVAPADPDQQDSIISIATDDQYIYASVEYRFEDNGRPNFFIIDRKTLEITKRVHVKSINTLHIEGGKLMICNCYSTENQACSVLDPITLDLTKTSDKVCVAGYRRHDNNSFITVKDKDSNVSFVAVTHDYLVSRERYDINSGYTLYPRVGGKPLPATAIGNGSLNRPVGVDGNDIVIHEGGRVILVSLPSGAMRTLFGLPNIPIIALHDHILYAGSGRDLLIFDLKNLRIQRYIKDFITDGFRSRYMDTNQIDRLIIDQDRLIALTFSGANSRIIRLSDLLE